MLGIKAVFGVEGKYYRQGLDGLKKQTKSWGRGIQGIIGGAFALTAVTQAFKDFFATIRETNKAAKLLNVSFDEMKKLKVISQTFNTELDDTKELLSNVNERIFEAAINSGHMKEEWEALGVSAEELASKSPIEQMVAISDAFKNSEDRAAALAAGIALFGDDFKRTIEVIEAGGDAIQGVADEVDKTPEALTRFVKDFDATWRYCKALVEKFLGFLILTFESFVIINTHVWMTVGKIIGSVFDGIQNAAVGLFKVISGAATLDFEKVKEGAHQMGRGVVSIFKDSAKAATEGYQTMSREINSVWNDMHQEMEKTDLDGARKRKALRDKEKEELKEIAELQKKLLEEQKAAQFEAMTLERQRNQLLKERGRLEEIANNKTKEGIEASREILKINKKLQAVNDKIKAEEEKSQQQIRAKTDSINKIFESVRKKREDREFSKMDSGEQLETVNKQLEENTKKQIATLDQINEKIFNPDTKKEDLLNLEEIFANLQKDEQELIDKRESLKLGGFEVKPMEQSSIIASSLASIGGGGGVFVGRQDPALDEARKQTVTLNKIEQGIAILNRNLSTKVNQPTTFRKDG